MDDLTSLTDLVGKLSDKVDKLASTPAVPTKGAVPDHPPAIRKGASALSSQPFRLTRLLGSLIGAVSKDEAKNEIEMTKSFRESLEASDGIHQDVGTGALMPVAKSFLGDKARSHKGIQEYFSALNGTGDGEVDLDEVDHIAHRKSFGPSIRKTAMSYLNEEIGGSLVAPAEQGEIIPLMRNKSAVSAAGAKQVALPPQGKWVAPRITGPSTGYWITENTAITESNPTTGMVSMMAKKLGVLIRVPNELFKFATATNDAMLRDDIAKTLALGYDYACFYGAGAGQPKGIKNYTGTNEALDYAGVSPAPKGVATNGNTLRPEDGYRMKARIAQRNFDVKGWKWIGTPILQGTIVSYRFDTVAAADQAGGFAQDLTRALGFNAGTNWCGSEFVESAQVKSDYTKGSGTALTELFGGVWSEFLQGIYGAMEFATASQGDTAFAADQSLIRGILFCDAVPRYPGAFGYYKELLAS